MAWSGWRSLMLAALLAGHAAGAAALRNSPQACPVTVSCGALDLAPGPLPLTGRAAADGPVTLRLLTGRGTTAVLTATAHAGHYATTWPAAEPGWVAVDATQGEFTAEALLLLYDSRTGALPDLPGAFTADLLDAAGRRDSASREYPAVRAAVNHYLHSRGARLAGAGRLDFDLAKAADRDWWRDHLTLYDFRHRDRDWSQPLGQRPARTFWNSVWRTWYNRSNDHPLDGDPQNAATTNYCPYAFSNDFSDLLILAIQRLRSQHLAEDDLHSNVHEAAINLLAMQHRGAESFCRRDSHGRQFSYTAGAFHYGLFETGEWLTEGTGWFYNPAFNDYVDGGVLNGRCLWALGELLAAEPDGPLAPPVREALARGLRFCLRDALAPGYAHRTPTGRVYWRDAGEHAYLCLGLVAAARVAPELAVELPSATTLRAAARESLDALVDLCRPEQQWAVYPNVDSMAIAALAEGALAWPTDPGAARWRHTAESVADAWLSAQVPDYPAPPLHFGLRAAPGTMTYNWGPLSGGAMASHNTLYLYQTGHWLHALARLAQLSRQPRYRERAASLVRYLCGENPWRVRLWTELGGTYNWVEDTDGDGLEDYLKLDLYPESTAFCGIGAMHWLALEAHPKPR